MYSLVALGCYLLFLAVFADLTKSALEGAALEPTLFIFSPEPAFMRFFLLLMFAYNPFDILIS